MVGITRDWWFSMRQCGQDVQTTASVSRTHAAVARIAAGETFELDEDAYRSCACRIDADACTGIVACRVPRPGDGPVALGFRSFEVRELARHLEDGSISFAEPTRAAQARPLATLLRVIA